MKSTANFFAFAAAMPLPACSGSNACDIFKDHPNVDSCIVGPEY